MEEQPGQVNCGYEDVGVAEVKDPEDAADEGETEGDQEIQGTE